MPEEPTNDPVSLAIRAYADRVVARAPKFTDAQIARLRVLLRPKPEPQPADGHVDGHVDSHVDGDVGNLTL